MTKYLMLLRMAIVAGMLMAGALMVSTPVSAQDATQVAGEAAAQAEDVVQEDDEGFDWGLLGLLGLAGLAGLMRRPQPVVHDIDRTTTRTTGTRINDRDTTV
jgi:MYXO-CTERM domain-containing protein